MSNEDKGSHFGGFLLGLLFGVAGLLIGILLDKEETKRGVLKGFFINFIFGILFSFYTTCRLQELIEVLTRFYT